MVAVGADGYKAWAKIYRGSFVVFNAERLVPFAGAEVAVSVLWTNADLTVGTFCLPVAVTFVGSL